MGSTLPDFTGCPVDIADEEVKSTSFRTRCGHTGVPSTRSPTYLPNRCGCNSLLLETGMSGWELSCAQTLLGGMGGVNLILGKRARVQVYGRGKPQVYQYPYATAATAVASHNSELSLLEQAETNDGFPSQPCSPNRHAIGCGALPGWIGPLRNRPRLWHLKTLPTSGT